MTGQSGSFDACLLSCYTFNCWVHSRFWGKRVLAALSDFRHTASTRAVKELLWAWMPPRPHLSDTAAHKGKQGWNCWGLNDREKRFLFCHRHIKIQQAAESMAGQRPVSFPALRPSGRPKWVWASARKKRLAASGKPNALLALSKGRKSPPGYYANSILEFLPERH